MYHERQVAEQALRVGVSSRRWAIIVSRSSCGSCFAYGREVEASGSPPLKILLILALLRYQTWNADAVTSTRTCEGRD